MKDISLFQKKDVGSILKHTEELHLTELLVVGRDKDGAIHLNTSVIRDTVYIIGLLEALKAHVIEHWD